MSPESNSMPANFALLASGANFSCEALKALRQKRYLPGLLVLPEYAPSPEAACLHQQIPTSQPQRRLLKLAQDIDIDYAPQAQQAGCAKRIQRLGIDFLLVACWPYLIDEILINSARKATLNMHPSLLPEYRGPNPIEQQLMRAESDFGVSLHLLNQHFDQGDVIAQEKLVGIPRKAGRLTLERRNAELGTELFIAAVNGYERGWKPFRQPAQMPETE